MLTGQAPFPGDDPIVVMDRHLTETPPDPHALDPSISPALATIILRALAKLPDDRFGGYPTANGWTTYTIPLADLNASNVSLGSIVIHSWTNRPQPTVYVNDIRLLTVSR